MKAPFELFMSKHAIKKGMFSKILESSWRNDFVAEVTGCINEINISVSSAITKCPPLLRNYDIKDLFIINLTLQISL